jgi:hypothetical protein
MKFFRNLKHLSIIGSSRCSFPYIGHCNSPSSTFSSSTLNKLRIRVISYADCLAVLDGRFKQLRTLIVDIIEMECFSSNVYNMVSLHFIKLIFLTCKITID